MAQPLPFKRIGWPPGRVAVGTSATISPSERLDLINLASSTTEQQGCPATRWSLDDLAATLINRNAHDLAMSRSTIWRILDEADLKPHRSVYWLNSHDPDFDAKAQEICKLYIKAPMMYQQGRLVICCDEKTGMQALGRPHPTQPAVPGKPERREQDYIRYGTRVLIASFIVPTGELIGDLGPTRTSVDFATHLDHVAGQFPQIKGFDWVWITSIPTGAWKSAVSSLNCATSLSKRRSCRQANNGEPLTDPTHKHVFHFTPIHGSWLNQVELWFSVFGRRFLKRGDFASMADFETRLLRYVKTITGVMPIRTVGLTPGHRWCGKIRSVKPAVNNGKGARGLVQGPNSLNSSYTHPGRISGRPRKLASDLRNRHLDSVQFFPSRHGLGVARAGVEHHPPEPPSFKNGALALRPGRRGCAGSGGL